MFYEQYSEYAACFTTLSVETTVKEDLKMDSASFSETLTTKYEPQGVIILIFNLLTPEDFKFFQTSVLHLFWTLQQKVWFFL
jgi:hypothetical protein